MQLKNVTQFFNDWAENGEIWLESSDRNQMFCPFRWAHLPEEVRGNVQVLLQDDRILGRGEDVEGGRERGLVMLGDSRVFHLGRKKGAKLESGLNFNGNFVGAKNGKVRFLPS